MSLRVLLDVSVLSAPTLSHGIGRYVRNLALSLFGRAMNDPELEVLATAGRPLLGIPEVSADVPRVLSELSRVPLSAHPLAWVRSGHRALGRAIRMAKPDVLHTLDPHALAPTQLPCPHVVTCHHVDSSLDADHWHGADAKVPRWQKELFPHADRVIASSRATAQELITHLNVPRDLISVVPHGLKLSSWSNVIDGESRRGNMGLAKERYLLCVGGIDERKNVSHILSALKRAHLLLGNSDLRLVWAGHLSGAQRARLKKKAEDARVLSSLRLMGYVSDADLAALYAGAMAMVFTSKREGFGFPVVEAMAAGCPVITSNCSSMLEVGGRAALMVDPADINAIADAIVLLSDDNAERRRLGQAGKQQARSYSLEQMVEGTLAAYRLAQSSG